ncbi:MAG: PorT family protein [Bacteroidetes bacterium]|nr:PorT family protein [Bacteroidota bacterium]
MQFNKHKYGPYLSYGIGTGKRLYAPYAGTVYGKKPGNAISIGGIYAYNISEFLWLQTGAEFHAREWNWQSNGVTGKNYYPPALNKAREQWIQLPLQALVYTGHEQGRLYFSAGPVSSFLLNKSWQERTESSLDSQFSTSYAEGKNVRSFHVGMSAGMGSEFELNPDLLCRVQVQTQTQWYRRREAGKENSSAWMFTVAFLWVR